VLFCDLVGSTALSEQLDPEELAEVLRAYHDTCGRVIDRFDGHVARIVGDGLLVYFGYPLAHDDDAQRAVRAGLGIVEALTRLDVRSSGGQRLAVRLAIHTGLVVVGEMRSGGHRDSMAVTGETPNIAARLQQLAASNAVVISAATYRLVQGFFACEPLGAHQVKGITRPIVVYQVRAESTARSRLDVATPRGVTPLAGRTAEVELLRERWEQAQTGTGQVVVLSGEAGIGKSRLVRLLAEQVAQNSQAWLTPCQCSPYHQHSAFYPVIDLLERVVLHFAAGEPPEERRRKLEGYLVQYGFSLPETVPLFALLLSVPLGDDYAPPRLTPAQQKQRTMDALVRVLLEQAAQQPLLFVVEDLHWADPSTLTLLDLVVAQVPTARILALLTARPEYMSPWTSRAHLRQVTLRRLPQGSMADIVAWVAGGKELPAVVREQIIARSDGVPLFAEELTKTMLESGLLQEAGGQYVLSGPLPPLAIPTTLQDSLMARLDRLATVKEVAQLAAALGREFSYALLAAVCGLEEEALQGALARLVDAELLYQRDLPPQVGYVFKHALIQETAYHSLLKSRRQQVHRQIAMVLATNFADIATTQPEIVAHHYTEAGLVEEALSYWQRAGQRAAARSAYVEAISHLERGLALLLSLPDTPVRAQQELELQMMLGPALRAARGNGVPDLERAYLRARELCRQLGDPPQRFRVLYLLCTYYIVGGPLSTARELSRELLAMAEDHQDRDQLLIAHYACGTTAFWCGELAAARTHLEQTLAVYETWEDPQQRASHVLTVGQDLGTTSLAYLAWTLWLQGYSDQALRWHEAAVRQAQERGHPYSLVHNLCVLALGSQCLREVQMARDEADAAFVLASEHGFPGWLAVAQVIQGWVLVEHGQGEEGVALLSRGRAGWRTVGGELIQPYFLALLTDACVLAGRADEALVAVAEGLAQVERTAERNFSAELHRLQGELLWGQDPAEAEACLQRALAIARAQGAHALELRAAVSLSRLWQQQGKRADACHLLAQTYGWFSEGFDTTDLRAAAALRAALSM
jgi:class 3 adenylate cyclase/predicted ATPase